MRFFHAHNWREIARIVAPPTMPFKTLPSSGILACQFERFVFGVTTVIMECAECGRLEKIEAVGKPASGDQEARC